MTTVTAFDAMNDALEICSDLSFEMAPGFATHWSMGSETLVRLGYSDIVHDWATRYRAVHRHFPAPPNVAPINPDDEASWKAALGDFGRVGDWLAMFSRLLQEQPWRDVLAAWWPRFMPGVGAGLTHGLIRTAHAVRSITASDAAPSQLQLRELATGLAYWGGKYVEQPGPAGLFGSARLPDLIAEVPRLPPNGPGDLRGKGSFEYMPLVTGWPEAISRLASPDDLDAAFSDMTLAFVQVNLAHPDQFPIPLIHSITAPAAVRMTLPHLPEHLHIPSYLGVWQAAAGLLAMFAPARRAEVSGDGETAPVLTQDELVARAVEHGDEHAIKLTEACLREHRIRPDPRYLLLPERLLDRIPRPPSGRSQ